MNKIQIYFFSFLLLFFSLTKQNKAQVVSLSDELNKKLPSSDLINDLDSILVKVYNKDNGQTAFNYISESNFNEEVKKVKDYFSANDSLSRNDFYKQVGPLLSSLKDDHLQFNATGDWMKDEIKEKIIIPLSILVYNNNCYVALSDTIPVKSKIISINNIPMIDIVKNTLNTANFSQYYSVIRNQIVSFDLPKYAMDILALYNFSDKVLVKYIPYGEEQENIVTIPLLAKIDKNMVKNFKIMPVRMDKNRSLEFKDNIAILKLPSFLAGWNVKEIGNGLKQWNEFFIKTFYEIDSVKPDKLLIDISNNGGGSDYTWFILLNYLCNKKISISFNNPEETPLELFNNSIIPLIGDSLKGQTMFEQYKGKIYLLISEMTFSAAESFADIFKINNIGTIIGRETRAFRSHYGEMKSYTLAKTGFTYSISSKFFISPSGQKNPYGVIPDYEIKINSVDDLFGRFGNDYLLNEAIKYISD